MKTSGFLKGVTKLALRALIKATKADIRTHGEENLPAGPAVYVVNHFTRMETFFLPYVIEKAAGMDLYALAHFSFFSGAFGRYLESLGAISTRDPERDRIMTGGLLRGDHSCMIFPEGQMVKDKKLIERGKFMIYNAGIRRPPHTGAGLLALRTEFYRAKLARFLETGYEEGVNRYMEYFGMDSREKAMECAGKECVIVPVNITYFPIRARNNIVNRLARVFVEKLPERIEEELEVEGTMLSEGVDIDINFGPPIDPREYLSGRGYDNRVRDRALYLSGEEMKRGLRFGSEAAALMKRYMESIYALTTVNHDHVFAGILQRYRKKRISLQDFKNRAFLALDRIREIPMQSSHTSLGLKQRYLLTDDPHGRFESFMDAAKSDGLIVEEGGFIHRNRERFSKVYEFHDIRRDNIVEVLGNEIEPLSSVAGAIGSVMRLPSCLVRRRIRNMFLEMDRRIFESDYERFFLERESKPMNIGRPFFLRRFFSGKGILLIHGYMAAPEEVRALGEYLYRAGYTVYGVRLRGHGTAPEDLAGRKWEEWYESANRGYIVLKNTVKKMAVAGFSTGAGVALYQAINKGGAFRCIVSINAPLKVNNIGSRLASTVVLWNSFLDRLRVGRGKMEYVKNDPENSHINYFRNPVSGVAELEKFMDVVEKNLKDLRVPALIVQGSKDPVVNPVSGLEIFDRIGGTDKELCRLYAERHGIVNGEGSLRVFRRVERYLGEAMAPRQ